MDNTTNLLAVAASLLLLLVFAEITGKVGSRTGHFDHSVNGIRLSDLTDSERGEEDIGIEGGLSDVQRQAIPLKQRLAWTA